MGINCHSKNSTNSKHFLLLNLSLAPAQTCTALPCNVWRMMYISQY